MATAAFERMARDEGDAPPLLPDVQFPLRPDLACADFHDQLFQALQTLRIPATIDARPYDLEGPPFPHDRIHDTYDAEAAHRWWRITLPSAYLAGARTADWDVTDLATRAAPGDEP